jgi:hypothetical protein
VGILYYRPLKAEQSRGSSGVQVASSELHVGRYRDISGRTEGHSFGYISDAVKVVALSTVAQASYDGLFCLVAGVTYSLEQRVSFHGCYEEDRLCGLVVRVSDC